jgi:hypothetical protein
LIINILLYAVALRPATLTASKQHTRIANYVLRHSRLHFTPKARFTGSHEITDIATAAAKNAGSAKATARSSFILGQPPHGKI